jgi:hypothetical protein
MQVTVEPAEGLPAGAWPAVRDRLLGALPKALPAPPADHAWRGRVAGDTGLLFVRIEHWLATATAAQLRGEALSQRLRALVEGRPTRTRRATGWRPRRHGCA